MEKFPEPQKGKIKQRPWPVYVATGSCILALIHLVMPIVWPLRDIPFSYIILTLLLSLFGVLGAIIALFSIPRYGYKGILLKALLGLFLNGFLLLLWAGNFLIL